MSDKRGTRRKPTKRTGTKRQGAAATSQNEKPKQGTPRGGQHDDAQKKSNAGLITIVVALLVVALGIGGYAFWRSTAGQQEQQDTGPVPIDVNGISEERLERTLKNMTLEQKVAQLFIVRPETLTDVGTVVDAGDTTRRAINNYPVGGICYFDDNIVDPDQTSEMLRNSSNYAKDACGLPLFLCVDEEGGSVTRVANNDAFDLKDVGDMSDIGASGNTNEAFDAARYMGNYLKDLGFNVDFAPVCDIVTSQDSPLADRSFGDTPEAVSPMVKAQIEGFTRAGILCSAKHFPGIGAATDDSHDQEIYSSKTVDEMAEWELLPFSAAIEAGVPMVMVGHLTCTGVTPLEEQTSEGENQENQQELPATYDPDVIDGILRKRLGYQGIVVTDSLEMGAVAKVCKPSEQGVLAIKAGADLILLPEDFKKAYTGLLDAVKSGEISEDRINESVRRIIAEKLRMIA